jgi:hypothetical protein
MKLQDKKNYISKRILLNIKNRINQHIIAKGLDYSQGVVSMVYNQKYPEEYGEKASEIVKSMI